MNTNRLFKKTRFAPTPSGYLHMGNLLSFTITDYIAKKENAEILLRIDDLDAARTKDIYIRDVFDTLNFFGIQWNYGPLDLNDFKENFSQANRITFYNDALALLRDKGLVYACICSRKTPNSVTATPSNTCDCAELEISLDSANAAWRFKTANGQQTEIFTYGKGLLKATLPEAMKNFIVKKKDGHPSYQLSSVIDDVYFGVDLVIRGNDLYPSTIAQNILSDALGKDEFKQVAFLHHPLIYDLKGEKLSKTDGATALENLRRAGLTAIDFYNQLAAMLGYKQKVNSGNMLAEMVMNDFYYDANIQS